MILKQIFIEVISIIIIVVLVVKHQSEIINTCMQKSGEPENGAGVLIIITAVHVPS